MTYASGFVIIIQDKTTISVAMKLAPDGHSTDPVCTGHPACIGDPASIRTNDHDPRLVMGTRLLFETRLVLEVLRYTTLRFFLLRHTTTKCHALNITYN